MIQRNSDTPYARFELKDGILWMYYKRGLTITYEIAKEIIRLRLGFSENKNLPLLIVDEGILGMDKRARDLFSSSEGTSKITASALVLNTVYSRVIGNFFIKLTKPSIPVRIFNDREKAIEWLQPYKIGQTIQ